jgi:hypothetical protein
MRSGSWQGTLRGPLAARRDIHSELVVDHAFGASDLFAVQHSRKSKSASMTISSRIGRVGARLLR